jgi:hypothetical protein
MSDLSIREKYAEVPCYFISYYKSMFYFRGEASDGAEVNMSFTAEYRMEVKPHQAATIKGGCDGYSYYNYLIRKDGVEIDSDQA